MSNKDISGGGFPVYILDNGNVLYTSLNINHDQFWEETVHYIAARQLGVPSYKIKNLPYCQKRARIVGHVLYCGESLPKRIKLKLLKLFGPDLDIVHDDHEVRCEISTRYLKGLKNLSR